MTQSQDSLNRLTLRQLRYKASELSVPLYSRKSKEALINSIVLAQERQRTQKIVGDAFTSLETKVVFLPRDPEWAYVFWELSDLDKKRAQSQNAYRLSLRLIDVTGISDGSSHKQTMQEIQVDSHSTEWYLPIPLSDREYRVELGYRFDSKWKSLAYSSSARVPSLHPSDQVLDQFVPFSLDTNSVEKDTNTFLSDEEANRDLHERLYQTATTYFRRTRIGSEEFQESRSGFNNFNESGTGLWASGRNESGVGVAPTKRSFWLVADAELIVYGSTDPGARLTIGGQDVPLSNDGTFRLQVPFRDGVQNYPIEATIDEGGQSRNITIQFERKTPEDTTSPSDQTNVEWF